MDSNKSLNTKSEKIDLNTPDHGPDESWSKEAIKLYNSIESDCKWKRYYPLQNGVSEHNFQPCYG